MTFPHGGTYLMTLTIDSERALDPVGRLHRAYSNPPMPEDVLPEGLVLHSPEYRLFLTLVVAVDYARDADKLWVTARRSHESPGTRYLINPNDLLQRPSHEAERDLRQSGLFAGPDDSRTWITLSRGCDGSHLFVCSMSFHRILRGGTFGGKTPSAGRTVAPGSGLGMLLSSSVYEVALSSGAERQSAGETGARPLMTGQSPHLPFRCMNG